MISIRTTIHDRRIELAAPDSLPDGTEVVIHVAAVDEAIGVDESPWDDTPAGIEAWLAWYDSLEPLVLTEEELGRLTADEQSRKDWEKSQFQAHGDSLAREWQ